MANAYQPHSSVLSPRGHGKDFRGGVKGQGGSRGQQVHHGLQRPGIGRSQARLLGVDIDHARLGAGEGRAGQERVKGDNREERSVLREGVGPDSPAGQVASVR